MAFESDEQIALRVQRDRAVKDAWRQFNASQPRRVRRAIAGLPSANPEPKKILVTKNRDPRVEFNWSGPKRTRRP